MKKKYLIFLLLLSFPLYTRAGKTLDSLLNVLDLTIQEHETYVVQRESRIKHLKELTHGIEPNSAEQYNLNSQIYKEYKAFICDSAIHYLNENIRIAERLHDADRKIESQLQLSLLLSSTGMYKESLDVLESVDRQKIIPRLIADYYTCFDHVYGELGKHPQRSMVLNGRTNIRYSRKTKILFLSQAIITVLANQGTMISSHRILGSIWFYFR